MISITSSYRTVEKKSLKNASICLDVFRRTLRYEGYRVKKLKNMFGLHYETVARMNPPNFEKWSDFVFKCNLLVEIDNKN